MTHSHRVKAHKTTGIQWAAGEEGYGQKALLKACDAYGGGKKNPRLFVFSTWQRKMKLTVRLRSERSNAGSPERYCRLPSRNGHLAGLWGSVVAVRCLAVAEVTGLLCNCPQRPLTAATLECGLSELLAPQTGLARTDRSWCQV